MAHITFLYCKYSRCIHEHVIDTFYAGSQLQFHAWSRSATPDSEKRMFYLQGRETSQCMEGIAHRQKERLAATVLHLSFCIPSSQMTVGGIMGHSHCELCPEWKTARLGPKHITVNSPSHLSIY